MNDASDAFAFVHQVESFVDLRQVHVVGDELVDLEGSAEIFFDEFRNAFNALVASECCSLPSATSDELEWASADLLTGSSDSDDDTDAPALVSGLQSLSHRDDVADALERVVQSTVGQLHQVFLEWLRDVFRVDELGGAELLRNLELARVDVDADNASSTSCLASHDDGQTNSTESPNGARASWFDSSGVQSCTIARWNLQWNKF